MTAYFTDQMGEEFRKALREALKGESKERNDSEKPESGASNNRRRSTRAKKSHSPKGKAGARSVPKREKEPPR